MRMFPDRAEAGRRLADALEPYRDREDALVLGLPRGGVVVAHEVARTLRLPLDLLIVRKIGFPGQPEFGIGAVSEVGQVVLSSDVIAHFGIPPSYVDEEIARQREEIARRAGFYRGDRPFPELKGRIVVLVDDGVATGSTIKAGIATLGENDLQRLVVAVPVAPPETALELEALADEFHCLATPVPFGAVGAFYGDFRQVSDGEVVRLLSDATSWRYSHDQAA